jgi:hypothetical protein
MNLACAQVRGAIIFMQLLHKAKLARQARAFDIWAEWLRRWNRAEFVVTIPAGFSASTNPSDLSSFQKEVIVLLPSPQRWCLMIPCESFCFEELDGAFGP